MEYMLKSKLLIIPLIIIMLASPILGAWWNSSYSYRMNVTCTDLDDDLPIVINGSGGFHLSGTSNNQIIWTICNGTGTAVYYNSYSDYAVGNDTDALPFEVEAGNETSHDPESVWGSDYELIYLLNHSSDSSSNSNDGAVVGATRTTGKIDGGYSFDGDNDKITSASDLTNLGTSDFSVSVWFKTSQSASYVTVVSNADEMNGLGWAIEMHNGKMNVIIHITRYVELTGTVNDDTWHYYTFVREGTSLKSYLDGVLNASHTVAVYNIQPSEPVVLGDEWTGGCTDYNGLLDDMKILTVPLSASEIYQTYNNTMNIAGFGNLMAEEAAPAASIFSIIVSSPSNGLTTADTTPDCQFTVTGNALTYSCTLYFNSTNYGVNANTANNSLTTISASPSLSDAGYDWWVNCTSGGVENKSNTYGLTIAQNMSGTVKDSASNGIANAYVVLIYQSNHTVFRNTTTTSSGAWTVDMDDHTGHFLIVTYNSTTTTDGDAAPHVIVT